MKQYIRLAVFAIAIASGNAFAGKIVVNNDEWTFSDTGFAAPGTQTAQFAVNVASFFSGGGPGSFLTYSSNGISMGPAFASTMTGAGHSYTKSVAGPFDLPTLSAYTGVYLALPVGGVDSATMASVLISYVSAGGNVYIEGGTGVGGAASEAAYWAPFLNNYGMAFTAPYNGIGGVQPVAGAPHAIFSGVSALYQNNGNTIAPFGGGNPNTSIYLNGLFAVYDAGAQAIPEPLPLALFALALGLMALPASQKRGVRV